MRINLSPARAELLRQIAADPVYISGHIGDDPAPWGRAVALVELGFARWSEHGLLIITPEGRAILDMHGITGKVN